MMVVISNALHTGEATCVLWVLESFVEDSAGFEELLMLAVDAC
jgi:hypothetical protein